MVHSQAAPTYRGLARPRGGGVERVRVDHQPFVERIRRVDFHAVLGHDVVVLKPDAADVDLPELDDDINRATVFFDGDAGKADIIFPSVPPILNTIFVAVPGADNVQVILVECETLARAAIVDHLGYARDYLPLAHRSVLVYADVFRCVQVTVDAEDTYRQPVYIHNEGSRSTI